MENYLFQIFKQHAHREGIRNHDVISILFPSFLHLISKIIIRIQKNANKN